MGCEIAVRPDRGNARGHRNEQPTDVEPPDVVVGLVDLIAARGVGVSGEEEDEALLSTTSANDRPASIVR